MRPKVLLTLALCLLPTISPAADRKLTKGSMREACDSLSARCGRRFGVTAKLAVKNVTARSGVYDFHFTNTLSDMPWGPADIDWFKSELAGEVSGINSSAKVGGIYANYIPFAELAMPSPGNSGTPMKENALRHPEDPARSGDPGLVRRIGDRRYTGGLSGRHISIWQSHGRYFDNDDGLWKWQRARLHRTVEDLYTSSYVLPFLIPMLENAGARVMTPRERDTQWREVVCDNDPTFSGSRDGDVRVSGSYRETGHWTDAGTGFADKFKTYRLDQNPFTMGTARKTSCSPDGKSGARWTPPIAERGEYAVYISYRSLANSSTRAHYTVRHLGGTTEFEVNQKRGGGTWIYLGTFEFGSGSDGWVALDNRGSAGEVVTADAVRFGGGMGKIERGGETSGFPCFAEGALYNFVWSGVDTTAWVSNEWNREYVKDYAMRGAWLKEMRDTRGIPFDLALAFHSNAGTTPNDSTCGTLAIYTLKCEGKREYSDGSDRMNARMFAKFVQDQVVGDIRAEFDPEWTRKELWDRSYSESRTTDVPTIILELLSHQNFADMKYGLDPNFRFTACRSVYKGILKFLSELYGCNYTVQPLPVHGFAARKSDGKASLSWKPTADPLEPTAVNKGYIVYTRVDDGVFDSGMEVSGTTVDIPISAGHVYSFKVEAWNDGGRSFPSEILSVGIAANPKGQVLVVNNFDRVSAPAWVESPGYAGFDARLDSGVPWNSDYSYIGENYEFRRSLQWITDENPGFGASTDEYAGRKVAGNTFDFTYVHGKSLLALGYSFQSASREAFVSADWDGDILDLICGKQLTTCVGTGKFPDRYSVFPDGLQEAIRKWTGGGRSVLVSGSRIATDCWDRIYPTRSLPDEKSRTFCREVLGYKLCSSFGTYTGEVKLGKSRLKSVRMPFHHLPNPDCYCVERCDGIEPADRNGKVWLRYTGTDFPAAIQYKSPAGYRITAIGVPLECFKNDSDRQKLFKLSLEYLDGTAKPVDHGKVD